MSSIFTKIINGEIPALKVAENDNYLAFLDVNPVQKGHVLVIPKVEIDYIFDLEDNVLEGLMSFAKKVGKGIEKVIPCNRIGVTVIGLEVPHAHIHLIPINELADMDFKSPRVKLSKEVLSKLADDIVANI